MRILFYIDAFPSWGGIESVTEIIGTKLVDEGHQVFLLAHSFKDRDSSLIKRATIFYMPDKAHYYSLLNEGFAIEIVQNVYPDVIVFQDSYAPIEKIAVHIAECCGARLFTFEHNDPSYLRKEFPWTLNATSLTSLSRFYRDHSKLINSRLLLLLKTLLWYYKNRRLLIKQSDERRIYLLEHSKSYVVISKSFMNQLQKKQDVVRKHLSHRICYINNPIEMLPAPNVERENSVLFVGRIVDVKRLEIMIRAWEILNISFKDWTFYIVGDGPLREKYELYCKNKSIERVVFLGYQNPICYYQKAKIFWMTSIYEGWGMTLVEAMRGGCVPVVMNTFASSIEIVDDMVNGVVTENCFRSFLRANQKLMNNECLIRELSENARIKIKKFSIENIYPFWVNLLK